MSKHTHRWVRGFERERIREVLGIKRRGDVEVIGGSSSVFVNLVVVWDGLLMGLWFRADGGVAAVIIVEDRWGVVV